MLSLSAIPVLRSRQYCTAAFVSNKLHQRRKVLNNCTGSSYSKDIMERSGFASSLFGKVPESLVSRLDGAAASFNQYLSRPQF